MSTRLALLTLLVGSCGSGSTALDGAVVVADGAPADVVPDGTPVTAIADGGPVADVAAAVSDGPAPALDAFADADEATLFLGTWRYTSGTRTIDCGVAGSGVDQLTGLVTVAPGILTPIVLRDGDRCYLQMDITGAVAELRGPKQTCLPLMLTDSSGTPISETDTFVVATFTVTGTTASSFASGTAELYGAGTTFNCSIEQSGSLTNVTP